MKRKRGEKRTDFSLPLLNRMTRVTVVMGCRLRRPELVWLWKVKLSAFAKSITSSQFFLPLRENDQDSKFSNSIHKMNTYRIAMIFPSE